MTGRELWKAVRRPSKDPAADFWHRIRVGVAVFAVILMGQHFFG